MPNYIYNVAPDKPDPRDHKYSLVHADEISTTFPKEMCLKHKIPYVFDQGQLGSCTANALSLALDFERKFAGPYSRLQIYYNERALEGTVAQDDGAQIRDGIKTLAQSGVALETHWPYNITRFTEQPPAEVIQEAAKNTITQYTRLTSRTDFLSCLKAGRPFVLGFTVYESFESQDVATWGFLPMPKPGENILGGHAVTCIGHAMNVHGQDRYLIQNSWGDAWGDPLYKGCFWMPAKFMEDPNLVSDCWSITS